MTPVALRQGFYTRSKLVGMAGYDVPLDALLTASQQMIDILIGAMPADHSVFHISLERSEPDRHLPSLPAGKDLPAVRWWSINLDGLTKDRRDAAVAQLEKVLMGERQA